MDLTSLPHDIFLLIISYLEPEDCIRGRRVARKWLDAFTGEEVCRHVLRLHYPRAREVRKILEQDEELVDWDRILGIVASRYHFLRAGKPRSLEKLALAKSFVVPQWSRYHGVATWQRNLQYEERTAPFHYPDPLWTYDDGLIIFPSSEKQRYTLYDLETQTYSVVSFDPTDKIVRRVRMADRVLIYEWCEENPYHNLNETEQVHRHFATTFDVIPDPEKRGEWKTQFRNEIKIHFLGMPLNSRDRFFSAHTSTHYAVMLWQPNRSAWGEDEPLESLAVWDISSPSSYQPSKDPTGKGRPDEQKEGTRLLRRLSYSDLDFYNVRQRSTPTLSSLELDENHVYVVEEDHRWLVGLQAGHNLPRLHKVKSVGIPFGEGPRWQDECGANGDFDLSFCERVTDVRRPDLAPCWRHEDFPFLTITEAVDQAAGVRYCARHCFMLETVSISVKPKVTMSSPGYTDGVELRDDLWQQLLGTGKIAGDERWLIGENMNQEIVILHFDRRESDTPGLDKGTASGAIPMRKADLEDESHGARIGYR